MHTYTSARVYVYRSGITSRNITGGRGAKGVDGSNNSRCSQSSRESDTEFLPSDSFGNLRVRRSAFARRAHPRLSANCASNGRLPSISDFLFRFSASSLFGILARNETILYATPPSCRLILALFLHDASLRKSRVISGVIRHDKYGY